jgi:hypothetical protein
VLASVHVAAGAVAGAVAMRLLVGHLAMDAIPHSDYAFIELGTIPWVGLVEALVACAAIALMARGRLARGESLILATGVAGSMAPDVKFVVRLIAPAYEERVTRITDAVHGLHATEPLHIWIAFAGEVALALGAAFVFWRLIRGARAPSRGRSTAPAVPPSAS